MTPDIGFLASNNDGKLFTKQGLHRNKFGKQHIVGQITTNIFSTFKPNGMKGIPLSWHKSIENHWDTNQVKTVKRNSNWPKKTVTRSADFLW